MLKGITALLQGNGNEATDDTCRKSDDGGEVTSTVEQVVQGEGSSSIEAPTCVEYSVQVTVESDTENIDTTEVDNVVHKFIEDKIEVAESNKVIPSEMQEK